MKQEKQLFNFNCPTKVFKHLSNCKFLIPLLMSTMSECFRTPSPCGDSLFKRESYFSYFQWFTKAFFKIPPLEEDIA